MTKITGLYSGSIKFFEPGGEKTGIFKDPVETVEVDVNGIFGDIQADRRFHGGPEKALHQYSIYSYGKIVETFPDLKYIAVPGSIGENISCADLDDLNVNIGDIYRIGSVLVQISQPRSPCWRINARFDNPRLARFIAQTQITGWYYRVLEHGTIETGSEIHLVERQTESVSIKQFTKIQLEHRPKLDDLKQLINCKDLNQDWKAKLQSRYDYLMKNK